MSGSGDDRRESPIEGAESWSDVGDRALVEALRRGESDAVDELIRRFEPLVARCAQWLRVPRDERAHWVGELLYDVALTLGRGRGAAPRHLSSYVVGACKYKSKRERAATAAYAARVREAAEQVSGASEYAALEACSQGSLRAARGPDWEAAPLSPVLERLVSIFDEALTANERQLLSWLGHQVSYTTIAEWLGVGRPAAVSRIQRLRRRLVDTAVRYGVALDREERAELVRFLRRAGAIEPAARVEDEDSHAATGRRTTLRSRARARRSGSTESQSPGGFHEKG